MRLGRAGPGRWRLAAACALLACACVNDPAPAGGALADHDEVRAVPGEHATIQQAVDAAEPGDLILVSPGVYREAVDVTTDDVVIRGVDRNDVILDGGSALENGVQVLEAGGVAIENLTARNYTVSGVSWVRVERYRGVYLNAYGNGEHGVHVAESVSGTLAHSYAADNHGAGFAISRCHPCDTLIDGVVAERNGTGYVGVNAGGDLLIVRSEFRHNGIGIAAISSGDEGGPPQREATVVGNVVQGNNAALDPGNPSLYAGGTGILVAGGGDNLVARNVVIEHDKSGIAAVVLAERGRRWWPTGNVVRGNVVEGSGMADLAAVAQPDAANCFAANTHASSAPADIEAVMPCRGRARGDPREGALPAAATAVLDERTAPGGAAQAPPPPPQADMPAAAAGPWEPAGAPREVDVAGIAVPRRP